MFACLAASLKMAWLAAYEEHDDDCGDQQICLIECSDECCNNLLNEQRKI